MYIVAGLGNPDSKYSRNFHNLGFMAIDCLAGRHGVKFEKSGYRGKYSIININGEKVIFVKPQTYMNLSGECIQAIASYYKIPSEKIIVVYDDIDIPIGSVRIRANGSAGTHNGMRNIVSELGTTDFPRVRIGIKPDRPYVLIDYVLSDIRGEDSAAFTETIKIAADALDDFIQGEPIEHIMCRYNTVKKNA